MFREGFEPDNYRKDLAKEIINAPKEERHEILASAKETQEYQVARNKKIESGKEEEEIDDGMGVFIRNKTLYHGSATPGIKKLETAKEVTLGEGVYLTSKAKDAFGYAYQREGSRGEEAVVYETSVENLKLCDLRNEENKKTLELGFGSFLSKRLNELKAEGKRETFMHRRNIEKALGLIDSDKFKWGGATGFTLSEEITSYVKSLNYDGLVAIEGGEGDIGNHDSYVIFDPEKVKINKEQKIEKEKINVQ